jgi:glucose-6-phosphate isomerase
MANIAQSAEWKALEAHVGQIQATHLKDLLQQDDRTTAMIREHNGIYVDFARQNATQDTIKVRSSFVFD